MGLTATHDVREGAMTLEIHPAANAFPMMDKARWEDLVSDIEVNGLREAITLCGGRILDGRNRYKACQELGIEPRAKTFDGNPWAYVWSLNGARRDLADEQRYLIWKFCHGEDEAWQAEQARIAEEANRKRSKAMQGLPHAPTGERRKEVGQSVLPHSPKEEPGKEAKAAASKTNKGAVARGDVLDKKRPDLAEKVRTGEMKPADAHRTLKREEQRERLDSVEAREAKAISGEYDVVVIDPPWPRSIWGPVHYPEGSPERS